MVETIADLSVELGIPFISGKDSSSGTFEAGGKRIDVPATLAVATMGGLTDVKKVVSKDFKHAGNRLVLVGRYDARRWAAGFTPTPSGSAATACLMPTMPSAIKALWDALLGLHSRRAYVSASAIAEGGIVLRLFEAAFGSGLGAQIEFDGHAGLAARWLALR